MKAKSTHREKSFVPGTSRNRETGVTLRLVMARDQTELLEMGQRLKDLRASHRYKQQWIADQLGVELRTFQFWQQGKNAPEQENLVKLADLFGVTPKYILKGETPEPVPAAQADPERLGRIEEHLDTLGDHLKTIDGRLAKLEKNDQTASFKRMIRLSEEILGRLGRDIGKRDLERRDDRDHPEEPEEDAA